jgi:hypothetical protein
MRFLSLITLTVLVLAAAATAATGATERRSDIPACEELLSKHEAALAMHQATAEIISRSVVGSSRQCAYAAFSKSGAVKSLELEWGPYAARRTMAAPWANKYLCPVSKAACSKFKTAATLKPNATSFTGIEKALALVGVTKWLHDSGFDGNPAFVWLPGSRLAPIDELAFVAVYVKSSGNTLQVGCTDNHTKTADPMCARRAAMWSYDSVP